MIQHSPARPNLLALTQSGMAAYVASLGWPAYRASQILRWLYQERVRTFAAMSNLPQKDRDYLAAHCTIERTSHIQIFSSQDSQGLRPLAHSGLFCSRRVSRTNWPIAMQLSLETPIEEGYL